MLSIYKYFPCSNLYPQPYIFCIHYRKLKDSPLVAAIARVSSMIMALLRHHIAAPGSDWRLLTVAHTAAHWPVVSAPGHTPTLTPSTASPLLYNMK